jgi:hypothetical protein
MRAALAIALFLLAAAPSARAQPAAAPPAEQQARLDAAQRLMAATGAIGMATQMLAGMQAQLIALLGQMNPGKHAEVQSLVTDVLLPEFRMRLGELEEPIKLIWAEAFTIAEMDELVAFYGTPLGRKALSVVPQIAQQAQAVGMAWGQRVAQEAIAKHEQTIRARGIRI